MICGFCVLVDFLFCFDSYILNILTSSYDGRMLFLSRLKLLSSLYFKNSGVTVFFWNAVI